jgi:hypothetical protein
MKVTCGNCHKESEMPQCAPGAMLTCPDCKRIIHADEVSFP